jgi:UDP-N-acetylmuramoyl-L-alanyl-D-glutamate--2,6-diaminopimelate ligase
MIHLLRKLFSQKTINTLKHLPVAFFANLVNFWPSRKLKIIGVTGTDGKTTTTKIIYNLLKEAGFKTAFVSTISAKIGDEEVSTGLHVTSPSSWKLQKLLRKMVSQKVQYVVLETTSHGLDQNRFWGINFEVGIVTNVTNEHLDYHKTWDNCLLAKSKLLNNSKVVILNKDDRSYERLKKVVGGKIVFTYSLKQKADFKATGIVAEIDKTKFNLKNKNKLISLTSPLIGNFNVSNQLAAIATARYFDVDYKIIERAIKQIGPILGRLEFINNKKRLRIVVDFAHTPNALKNTLSLLKGFTKKGQRLIVVFGTAGLRDFYKREEMGKIAGRLADFSVLTSEDPRTEDPKKIINQIGSGCRSSGMKKLAIGKSSFVKKKKIKKGYFAIVNRQDAINFAIRNLARPHDIVVMCGKGHERSMCFGTTEYPWSEHNAVKIALKEKR